MSILVNAARPDTLPGTRFKASVAADSPDGGLDRVVTRAFDVSVALAGILFLLPLMLLLALAVMITSRGPAIFAHSRKGYGGESFNCLKFRSMVADASAVLEKHLASSPEARAEWARDHKLRKDPRITGFGLFLRRSSLDELPQLFNVLAGTMSIVGPRPIVTAEIEKYGRYFREYSQVKPGITGLWQISGRNNLTYQRRVAIDTVYARSRSIFMDIRIVILTVPAVAFGKGSY